MLNQKVLAQANRRRTRSKLLYEGKERIDEELDRLYEDAIRQLEESIEGLEELG